MPPSRSRPQPATPPGTIADQLDRVIPAFDALANDARLGHPLTPARYHELEARAQAIADAVIAPFRKPSRTAPLVQRGGQAWW